jgi:hypothetical protein
MDTPDKYLAVAVTRLFVAGIRLLAATVRQQNRTGKQSGWCS